MVGCRDLGRQEGAGRWARVLILEGHRVAYDVKSEAVVRGICVSGSLTFAPDRDTELNVGLITVQPGNEYSEDGFDCDHAASSEHDKVRPELIVGTFDQPIAAGKSATIRLHYVEGMNKETCPAIVCCGGRMDFHGQPLLAFVGQARRNRQVRRQDLDALARPSRDGRPATASSSPARTCRANAKTESTTEERTIALIAR